MEPNREVVAALLDNLNFAEAAPTLDFLSGGSRTDDKVRLMTSTLYFLGLQQSAEEGMAALIRVSGFENIQRLYAGPCSTRAEIEAMQNAFEKVDVNKAIAARAKARGEKNWTEADRIRDELDAMGIQLKDAKDPDTGELVTTWEVKR